MQQQTPDLPIVPWPSMRGNRQNTGASDRAFVPDPSSTIRRWPVGGAMFSTPVIGQGEIVYVGGADGALVAFDMRAGAEIWRFQTGGVIDSAAAIGQDGTLYVPSADGCLYAVSAEGKELWRFDLLRDREAFTPSTIYWWEGNVAVGPDGNVYAGNDDFRLYSLTPGGELRWSVCTGLHIWGTPAFFGDMVFVTSFDLHVYAYRTSDGRMLWKQFIGDFLACSPAVDAEGNVYVGALDGSITCIDGASGRVRWTVQTESPIYASATLTPDGGVCMAGSDGVVRMLDGQTGTVRWVFPTHSVIRGSGVAGPDPEGRARYLLYIADSVGRVYALTPEGASRWSYDASMDESGGYPHSRFPGVNGSLALGTSALCIPLANGEMLSLPYDCAARWPERRELQPGASLHAGGSSHILSPLALSGMPRHPVDAIPVLRAGEILTYRVAHHAGSFASVIGTSATYPHEVRVSSDGFHVHVVPQGIPPSGLHTIAVRAEPKGTALSAQELSLSVRVEAGADAVSVTDVLPVLRIDDLSIHTPAIVPTFDQIGLASLSIEIRVLHHDRATGRIVAWGIQRFGMDEHGNPVGVPIPRRLLFAFSGKIQGETLLLDSARCHFEITAFSVPLDRLRFSLRAVGDGGWEGLSCITEVGTGGVRAELWRQLWRLLWPRPGSLFQVGWRLWREARQIAAWMRGWFPHRRITWVGCEDLLLILRRQARLAWTFLRRHPWRRWGLLRADCPFCGVGTFRATAVSVAPPVGLHLETLRFHPRRRQVIARFVCEGAPPSKTVVPGILLLDAKTMEPLAIPYTSHTYALYDQQTGLLQKAVLDIPADIPLDHRSITAMALLDLSVAGERRFDIGALSPWTFWNEFQGLVGRGKRKEMIG